MTCRIIQGNVFDVLPTIAPGSIDCCVTSPPYWKLRSYLPASHADKRLELGSEKTVQEYIANMVRVFELVKTALADHACCFVNVGDTYAERGNLALVPQRLAIALQDAGWIIRSIIAWTKPAPMPESVAGWRWQRCRVKIKSGDNIGRGKQGATRLTAGLNARTQHAIAAYETPKTNMVNHSGDVRLAHNQAHAQWADCPGCRKCEKHGGYRLRKGSWRPTRSWEPILMLAKSADYFCDGEPVKTEPKSSTVSRDKYTRVLDDPDEQFAVRHDHETLCAGANARDVQSWSAEPLAEAHYAAFPSALAEWCLRAGTSAKGYCPACGKPWCRVIGQSRSHESGSGRSGNPPAGKNGQLQGGGETGDVRNGPMVSTKTIGWRPCCPCDAVTVPVEYREPRPGRILDPFSGSGRTGIAAILLGLDYLGVELSDDYAETSRRLLREECPLFA